MLFTEAVVPANDVCGKCTVTFGEILEGTADQYFLKGVDRFYFNEVCYTQTAHYCYVNMGKYVPQIHACTHTHTTKYVPQIHARTHTRTHIPQNMYAHVHTHTHTHHTHIHMYTRAHTVSHLLLIGRHTMLLVRNSLTRPHMPGSLWGLLWTKGRSVHGG